MKKAILVVGVGRSGTSAISGTLNILGANLGADLLPANKDNVKGYFENIRILSANEYILNHILKTSWHEVYSPLTTYLTDKNFHACDPIPQEQEILHVLKYSIVSIFWESPVIAIKDPRISLLLPFYQKVLHELGYDISYIVATRNHEDVKKSLAIYGFDEAKCEKIIKDYKQILDLAMPDTFLKIQYEELLDDTDNVLISIKEHLPFLNYESKNIQQIKEFIDTSLRSF